jgi:Myb-like DNA-binding domain
LNKHGFKVLSAPAPVKAAAAARAITKVVAKKKRTYKKRSSSRDKQETNNQGETSRNMKVSSRDKKDSTRGKKETIKQKEVNVTKPGRGGSSKAAAKVPGITKPPVTFTSLVGKTKSQQILESIAKHGLGDWELIASEVPDWTAEACRRRYELYLDPTLSKEPFTKDELREIMLLQSEHGNDWAAIAPKLTIPRSCVLLSDKWNRQIRNIILLHLLHLGLTRKQIEDNDKKQINYHDHFEEALAQVAAAKL